MSMKTLPVVFLGLVLAGTLGAAEAGSASNEYSGNGHSGDELSSFLSGEISSLNQSVQGADSGSARVVPGTGSDEGYYFRRFWLRVRPRVGIEVDGLAGLEVIPETEMLWEKEPPEGWAIYKP